MAEDRCAIRWLVLPGALLGLLLATASVAAAEPSLRPVEITTPEGQLGARLVPVPAIFTTSGDTGGQVRLDNIAALEQVYRIRTDNYVVDANGRPAPAPPDYPFGSADWYRFEETEFTLPPGTSRDVRFALEVPPNATAGDHIAALTVTVEAAEPAAITGSQVQSRLVFQIRIQHRVPGAQPAPPRIELEAVPGMGRVDFAARITNDGNTVLTHQFEPLPSIELYSTLPLGDLDEPDRSFTLEGFYVAPQSERLNPFAWTDPPLVGSYRAVFTLPPADGMPAFTAEATFLFVDWLRLGLLAAVTLIVVGGAVTLLVRRRRSGARLGRVGGRDR